MPHRTRFTHDAEWPVHVTLRAGRGFSWFRRQRVAATVIGAIRASHKPAFRIVHFSLQTNHVHLLVEAAQNEALSGGVAGLKIRIARRLNLMLGRRGAFWAERWHGRLVSSLRQVRRALVYVLANGVKHGVVETNPDPLSSSHWFDGWEDRRLGSPARDSPVKRAETHALARGWRRFGLIRTSERPMAAAG